MVAAIVTAQWFWSVKNGPVEITYSQFISQLEADNVTRVVVVADAGLIQGDFKTPAKLDERLVSQFQAILPFDDPAPIVARLEAKKIPIVGSRRSGSWLTLLLSVLPWVFIIGFWILMTRGQAASAEFPGPDSVRPPCLRVSLWKDLDSLAGHTWRWPVAETIGAASLCTTENDCRAATKTTVWLEPGDLDSVIVGRLRLEFVDRPTLAGSFRAPWRRQGGRCG